MLVEKERLEYATLKIICDAGQPVGCGAISAILQQQGYMISEATVGRLLRDFDVAGYTVKAGYQGRTLSPAGYERMNQLANKEKSLQWGAEFASALQGRSKEQLLEVLVARRAIESEIAALAAIHATCSELHQLREVVESQKLRLESGGVAAQQDVDFHALIAQMARNRVLGAAIALIRQDTQLSPVLEFIRKHVNSLVYIDHKKMYQAICSRQPELARQAMLEHINNLITDVERYWELTAAHDTPESGSTNH